MDKRFYMGDFSWDKEDCQSWDDVCGAFEIDEKEPDKIFAAYATPSYEGHALVVFNRDGKWFLVVASHCSCHGLEGQWEPELFDSNTYWLAKDQDKHLFYITDIYHEDEWNKKAHKALSDWMTEHCPRTV